MGQNSPFRGGLGPCGSKCPISQKKKAEVVETAVASLNIPFRGGIGAVWVRTAGGGRFKVGLGLCGSKRRAVAVLRGDWGRMGQNGGRRAVSRWGWGCVGQNGGRRAISRWNGA